MRDCEQPARDFPGELLRARLQGIEQRLASANQVGSLLDAATLPPTFRVESVIGRAEQALSVWASLKAF